MGNTMCCNMANQGNSMAPADYQKGQFDTEGVEVGRSPYRESAKKRRVLKYDKTTPPRAPDLSMLNQFNIDEEDVHLIHFRLASSMPRLREAAKSADSRTTKKRSKSSGANKSASKSIKILKQPNKTLIVRANSDHFV